MLEKGYRTTMKFISINHKTVKGADVAKFIKIRTTKLDHFQTKVVGKEP